MTLWVVAPIGGLAAEAWPSAGSESCSAPSCPCAEQPGRLVGKCHWAAAIALAPYVACFLCNTCTAQGLHRHAAPQHQPSPLEAALLAAEPAAGAMMCPPAFEGMSELKVEFQGHIMRLEQLIEHHRLREADPTGGRSALLHHHSRRLASHNVPEHCSYAWSS